MKNILWVSKFDDLSIDSLRWSLIMSEEISFHGATSATDGYYKILRNDFDRIIVDLRISKGPGSEFEDRVLDNDYGISLLEKIISDFPDFDKSNLFLTIPSPEINCENELKNLNVPIQNLITTHLLEPSVFIQQILHGK